MHFGSTKNFLSVLYLREALKYCFPQKNRGKILQNIIWKLPYKSDTTKIRGLGQIYHLGGFPTWFFREQNILLPKWISNPGSCFCSQDLDVNMIDFVLIYMQGRNIIYLTMVVTVLIIFVLLWII